MKAEDGWRTLSFTKLLSDQCPRGCSLIISAITEIRPVGVGGLALIDSASIQPT